MKTFWKVFSVVVFMASAVAFAADINSTVNTADGRLYNKAYRDIKNGTNAEVFDNVFANDYFLAAATGVVKSSPGYIHSVQLWTACQNQRVIADGSVVQGANSYALTIATIPANFAAGNIPLAVRVSSGIVWGNSISSCAATFSAR